MDLLKHDRRILCVHVQVVIELLAEEVIEELLNTTTVWLHILGAELGLGLTLKDGFFDLNADSGCHAIANISVVEVLPEEIFDDTGYSFLEG